ncbi:CaiB/BaiF CoA transferase family protein [Alkaliphilus peptidifermentans]|uniref:CoA:oxalate CoA-transferase n=1 Tax=Alkaliphilus peptidifermentans DSM 18978 TaxID=1120976 RepID=A0A1G5ICH3_9FIRM|nr:CoA transferase [Alkaliphilus peptidifermentans]SCY73299.1 CoA:oxalate CoA-transferase [Alkaliphilus peptidifermentans DSM 18978]
MNQALEGVKVLDLTRVLAGPYATMVLGDMGADIIKIEMPGVGDDSRQFGPYVKGESAYFLSLNRNKRSITLNLKKEKARQLFIEMVKKCDVVVENFRPGTMEKLGLGYEELKKINPSIIYAACSGFGHTGPYSQRAAYDAVVQAMGGIMSITGEKDGKPTRVGPSIGDITAGLFSAIGILSALNYRNQTGKGQMVDVAMLDCQVAILENAIARYVVTGEIPMPAGNRHTSIVPFEPFETLDGEIMIAAGNDGLWGKLCKIMNREDLIADDRFKTNPLRNQNYAELRPIIAKIIGTKTSKEWLQILEEAGVPNGPINTIDKVLENPQINAREMIKEVYHPTAGGLKMPGVPIKMSETQGEIVKPAPILGQHTEEILKELLNLTSDEILNLQKEDIF